LKASPLQSASQTTVLICIALSKTSLPESHILVSFDVVSLFTNVPLDLALNGLKNRWNYIEFTKIPKEEFISIIKFVLSSTFFYVQQYNLQTNLWHANGSPLSPIIADLVMQDLEVHVLNSLNSSLPIYYRYVDDILLADHENDINYIFNKFNNYHNRLKFTIEYEKNRCLSFLDLSIKTEEMKIIIYYI